MKKSSITKIIGVLIAILAIVAIFCMFATAFNGLGERGNVFKVIFGVSGQQYKPVWLGIVSFGLLVLGVLCAGVAIALPKQKSKFVFIADLLILAAAGTLMFFLKNAYISANGGTDVYHGAVSTDTWDDAKLGAGPICVAIFSYLAAVFSFIGFALSKKED